MNIDVHRLLQFDANGLIGQSVAVLGIKGSGKSNTAAVLMEEMLSVGVPICVVDIAGEYHTLRDEFDNVAVIGRSITTDVQIEVTHSNVYQIARTSYMNGAPVVFDLSGEPSDNRSVLLCSYMNEIWRASAVNRIPLVIFLEECHNWIPQSGKTEASKIMIDIAAEGRKRGLSLVMIGQRSTRIHKDTLTQADVAFLHRVRHPTDMKVYMDMIPRAPSWVRKRVFALKTGEALVLTGDKVLRCMMRLRRTRHVGFTPTLDNVPSRQMSLLDLMVSEEGCDDC